MEKDRAVTLDEIRQAPWYKSLYINRTEKTRQRDWRGLREMKFIVLDRNNRVWPGFSRLDQSGSA